MCKNAFVIALCIIATCHFTSINAGRTAGRRGYYGGYQPTPAPQVTEPPQTPKEYLDRKSGFSTFGIITIIFFIILACLIFYYGIMCYPLLCRDEKKYRFMDVSSTITSATSRSIQSIENFPVDQKH
ncbi:uncharacterized protein LOC101450283 [Ceratitis capitata]|uniref:(Mediterranean fruit fly) hypothetical protein n=1 Tax=Ceratitis capitata TaxID=7213 RepID=A0A811TZH1_CERCA|nr:uncharacterized protein LOC101450283 [Ceratitis capitata]CAD6991257.1 unnamed protein product [Ceratitis capitata]